MKNLNSDNLINFDYQLSLTLINEAVEGSENEEQLKIQLENILKDLCLQNDIYWNPYTYEHTLKGKSSSKNLDVVHGATIIEYESPKSFKNTENNIFKHACEQAESYASLLSLEEGRKIEDYVLVVWDGESISFGKIGIEGTLWEPITEISKSNLARLILSIKNAGRPIVNPTLLKQTVGPGTEIGSILLPKLYSSIREANHRTSPTRTKLIYTEWKRLFGQVDGVETERLRKYLEKSSKSHGINYSLDPQAYVFSLNTYIAIVAKLCAAFALLKEEDIASLTDQNPKIFLEYIESGECFVNAGIVNMLSSDFFSWYLGPDVSEDLNEPLSLLLNVIKSFDFNFSRKKSSSIRDLFKGLYMEFTPAPMRHALGEYYTPDWLASHILDKAKWTPEKSVLDPTCGSGTFILEVLKRKLESSNHPVSAEELLEGVFGCDLNPLAVLTAKASIVVFLADYFSVSKPVVLPIFLADAINTADPVNGIFEHTILTEKGNKSFSIPEEVTHSNDFFSIMESLKIFIDTDLELDDIYESLKTNYYVINRLDLYKSEIVKKTISDLVELHKNQWNGIWCLILFDRIKAGCIKDIDLVVGNPPWVKWSNLPESYAKFIKPLCTRLDIFSDDAWVGGIQSDISTVITYHALERFVAPGGKLAFLITGTVFKNESSQGFRRWHLVQEDSVEPLSVELVEDYDSVKPFEGVANFPTLLILNRSNTKTNYPVDYIKYEKPRKNEGNLGKRYAFKAIPIPGTEDGPWMVGNSDDVSLWPTILSGSSEQKYKARKGVTTDANGIFFVEYFESPDLNRKNILILNDPKNGRNPNIQRKKAIVEKRHIYPLLRGRNIKRYRALPEENKGIIVPQKGMFGDRSLPISDPLTYKFLAGFQPILEKRSSYKRFQKGKPFWSLWSTGEYTFSPFKVVWKEMSGSKFVAAYVGSSSFLNEEKVIVPDHKVYFIPIQTENEAAYITTFLNSRVISKAINAYSSALSLGTSVSEYIKIPKFDPSNKEMVQLSELGKKFTKHSLPSVAEEDKVDTLVLELIKSYS